MQLRFVQKECADKPRMKPHTTRGARSNGRLLDRHSVL